MNLNLLKLFNKQPPAVGQKTLRALTRPITTSGGRQTFSTEHANYTNFEDLAEFPDPTASWRTLKTQRKNLLDLPYDTLASIALNLSPQLDKGRFDFLRFANPGYILDEEGNTRSVDGAKDFIKLLNIYYGSFKTHIDRMWTSIFIYGAVFKELVLNEDATAPADLAILNPILAKFLRVNDPVRGEVWELGQYQNHKFIRLADDRLVKYIAFDADVDNPYGRPLISPAVYAALTLLQLIDILQRVLANQGLSRVDYSLEISELLTLIDRNPDIAGNDEATAQFINDQVVNIQLVLDGLEPEQDYIHTSAINVNYATNPNVTRLDGLETIVKNLQRDVTNGMKSVATLSNVLDSTTETHGNLQLEYYVSAIQSMQQEIAESLKGDFDCANQVRGIPSDLDFMFKRQRTADKKSIAETEKVLTETILVKLEAGVISKDEAKLEIGLLKDELRVM